MKKKKKNTYNTLVLCLHICIFFFLRSHIQYGQGQFLHCDDGRSMNDFKFTAECGCLYYLEKCLAYLSLISRNDLHTQYHLKSVGFYGRYSLFDLKNVCHCKNPAWFNERSVKEIAISS